jgi:hypothetical protein
MCSSDEDWFPSPHKRWHKEPLGLDLHPLAQCLSDPDPQFQKHTAGWTREEALHAFRHFCKHDHGATPPVIVRLLAHLAQGFELTVDDVRGIHNYALHQAAKQDHLPVMLWLVATFQLNVDDVRDAAAFSAAVANGYLDMAQWLARSFDITIEDVREDHVHVLRDAADEGNLEMVKFLCTHFPITVEDTAFMVEEEGLFDSWQQRYCLVESAIQDGHLEVAQYVCTAVGLSPSMYGCVLQALVDTDNLNKIGNFLPFIPRH